MKSIEEIELIIDLSDYIRVIFNEISILKWCNSERRIILENNFRDRMKSVIIHFNEKIVYIFLVNLSDIFNDLVHQGHQPWSYIHMIRNFKWIVDILSDYINDVTIDLYKFACMTGNYKLIKKAFLCGINPNHEFISNVNIETHSFQCNGFLYVQLSMIKDYEMIKIYNLFLEYGLNIDILLYPVKYNNWISSSILDRAISNNIKLAERMFQSGCNVDTNTLYNFALWIGFENPKKMKTKKILKYLINTIINKTLDIYNHINVYNHDISMSPLLKLCNKLIDYHLHVSYKFVNEWYIINKETMIEYFIKRLLINGANTDVLNNFRYGYFRDQHQIHVFNNIKKMINNKIVPRKDAINFVRDVSEYLLPDIANVVFDYAYQFNNKTHYGLANEV